MICDLCGDDQFPAEFVEGKLMCIVCQDNRKNKNVVSSHAPFEILVPPIAPGQEMLRKTIMVEVVGNDEVITADSIQTIDIVKMQMMIKRLNETVRQLTGFKESSSAEGG